MYTIIVWGGLTHMWLFLWSRKLILNINILEILKLSVGYYNIDMTQEEESVVETYYYLEPLLFTWINFNPSTDK